MAHPIEIVLVGDLSHSVGPLCDLFGNPVRCFPNASLAAAQLHGRVVTRSLVLVDGALEMRELRSLFSTIQRKSALCNIVGIVATAEQKTTLEAFGVTRFMKHPIEFTAFHKAAVDCGLSFRIMERS